MKKVILSLITLCIVFSCASCGSEDDSSESFIVSYEVEEDGWNRSLLSKAGLDNIIEPEGEKSFTEDGDGNIVFTVTPADPTILEELASTIYQAASNYSETEPFLYSDTLNDDKTHFKVKYSLPGYDVTVELSLNESVLSCDIKFS